MVMAVLTSIYVLLTHRILRANQKMLVAQDRPILRVKPIYDDKGHYLNIRNIGKGAAIEVECNIRISASTGSSSSAEETFKNLNIGSLEVEDIGHKPLNQFENSIQYNMALVTFKYSDINGISYGPFKEEFRWNRRKSFYAKIN